MLHHGTVEMKSQVGVGTTVMVHLPSGYGSMVRAGVQPVRIQKALGKQDG